jgi:hypothetical protein
LFASGKSALPRPLVSLNETGSDYFESLTKIEERLSKGEIVEFYFDSLKIIKEIETNREIRRLEGRDKFDKEEAVASEWLAYWVTKAPVVPFFSDEEYKNEAFSRSAILKLENFNGRDIGIKRWVFLELRGADNAKMAKLFSKNQKQIDGIHIFYWQILLRTFFDTEDLLQKEFFRGRVFFEKEVSSVMEESDLAQNLKIRNFQLYLNLKKNKYERCRRAIMDVREYFVDKLITTYPKDTSRIQEIIMKSGFSTKEQCRDLLLETVGKNKSTEYLFEGLPKLERKTNLKK